MKFAVAAETKLIWLKKKRLKRQFSLVKNKKHPLVQFPPSAEKNDMPKRTQKELLDATEGLLPVITHDGEKYSFTGKTGERFSTGVAVREYEKTSGSPPVRIWVDADGNIYPE